MQVLDRVVASIGHVAITASDVNQECRFESFLSARWPPPPPDSATLTNARERLADQILLDREENPGPEEKLASQKTAAERLEALRKEYAHPQDYQRAVDELEMTEAEVAARLTQDVLMLRLIDQRLRPGAFPSDEAVAEYYHSTFVPEFHRRNTGAPLPPLTEVEDQIREILIQKRVNELLAEWIEELKPTFNVRFHEF